MQVTYTPDKTQLFWLQEKPKDPQIEPHAEIKMAQVLGFPLYICESGIWFNVISSLPANYTVK